MLKEIKKTNGKYSAGSDGEIYCYSRARNNAQKPYPFPLKKTIGSTGYYFVAIILNGKKKTQAVHSLICKTFYGNRPEEADCARHLDGDKLNNKPDNLCWGTFFQNEADKRRHGRTAIGERQGSAKLTDSIVLLLSHAIPLGLWNEDDAAKALNMKPKSIYYILKGRGWKHLL